MKQKGRGTKKNSENSLKKGLIREKGMLPSRDLLAE